MQSMQLDNMMSVVDRQSGLVGWLLSRWRGRARFRDRSVRQMQLLETLSVGGKRQLALVRCGREQFLVGMGAEAVSTIVKIGNSESEQGQ
ncbi:MAG: flagellar biosynthetic protein FliO [Acidobacteria bacterium]|nr:flagellar biosynthetic protein FliO [Acidobacteriota bacterium]